MPLALAVLIPLMYLLALISVKKGWINSNIWFGIALFGVIQAASCVIGMQSGEAAEFLSSATKNLIHEHEEAAEIFTGLWVALSALLVGSIWLRSHRLAWLIDAVLFALFAVQLYLAFRVGHAGGELVPR